MIRLTLPTPRSVALQLWLCCALAIPAGFASAQSAPASTSGTPDPSGPVEQKFERLVHEDGGSKIEEERVGGVTRRIQIQSKLGGKPYEVVPDVGPNKPIPSWNNAKDSAGKAVWQVGTF